jgi:hypothetical protein
MRAAVRLSTLALVVAMAVASACSGSAIQARENVCSELYGQGLTGCTEHCRPFGVLDFGAIVRADGSIAWTCECMPGPTLVEGGPTPEEEGSNRGPPEYIESPVWQVEVSAVDRGRGAAAADPDTSP